MEVPVGKQTVLGYPALVDDGETVSLKVFDSAEEAAETHRGAWPACSCCSSRNR
jgi:ATP-dependent helicase HrpA